MIIIGNYYSVNLSLFTFYPKASSSQSHIGRAVPVPGFFNRLVPSSLLYPCICDKMLFSHFLAAVCSYCLSITPLNASFCLFVLMTAQMLN